MLQGLAGTPRRPAIDMAQHTVPPVREPRIAEIVHVVDDDPAVQTLFRQLARLDGFAIATYGAASPFLEAFDDNQPGCLVLDLNLPDHSGLAVLEQLAARRSQIPVVFMSGAASVGEAVSALKLGSIDFVEKPFAIADMTAAIQRALQADRTRRQTMREQSGLKAKFTGLTPREFEVMQLVVQGLANKAIASRLGVSPKTVEVHRAHVMQKTSSDSLAELVKSALGAGVANPANAAKSN